MKTERITLIYRISFSQDVAKSDDSVWSGILKGKTQFSNVGVRRLTSEIRSEKCVVRRFRRCANAIECTYTNPDCTV
jgi:hypothetical protein